LTVSWAFDGPEGAADTGAETATAAVKSVAAAPAVIE
jgi:hypothetical protein